MIYKNKKDLIIIKTDEVISSLSLKGIKKYLTKPNYNIYFEYNEEIYGVINIRDLLNHNDEDLIDINNTFDYISSNDQIAARKYFKDNNDVTEYPLIIDKKLIGAFFVGANLTCMTTMYEYYDASFEFRNENVYLIKSSDKEVEFFKTFLEKKKNKVKTISYEEFLTTEINDYFCLFETNSDYKNYLVINKILNTGYSSDRYHSLESFLERYNEEFNSRDASKELMTDFLSSYEKQGINVYCATFDYDKDIIALSEKIKEKYINKGMFISNSIIPREDIFFGEYNNEDYKKEIFTRHFEGLVEQRESGVNYLKDCKSNTFNSYEGIRFTTDTIDNPVGNIHMFGPCLTIGEYVEDKNTIESFVQRRLNADSIKMNVINHGSFNSTIAQMEMVNEIDLYEGDTIVYFNLYYKIPRIQNISLSNALKTNDIKVEWFIDSIGHVNHKINELYANEIYNEIKDSLKPAKERKIVEKYPNVKSDFFARRYLNDLDKTKKIGAVVVNCNPFTLGHQYLIEESSKRVDTLIVFVVSEDESVFTFNERFAMVLEGTKNLSNVRVVPTEDFIVTKTTFPEYFEREINENIRKHLSTDVNRFSDILASKLNIKYRFVGTEPIDAVTSTYNDLLKEILPKKGIELVELDRKEYENKPISASTVRNLLREENYEELKDYVPDTTIKCLLDKS